ncbi:MAG: FAD-dependent oxidoreductase [Thermoplasmata archaeon]
MDKFDVLVVGAGLAGSTAAYVAAQAGLQTVLVERGAQPGTKTVSGGLLYGHSLARLFPRFWEEEPSPVERAIDRNVISFLTPTQATSIDFFDAAWSKPPHNSFSVLRSRLDPWLAGKAEAAGAVPVYGVKVDELVREQGTVVGIKAAGDELRADVVILADGVNALLDRRSGGQPEADPQVTGIGVKEVLGLPPGEVQRRFQLSERSGTQYTTIGFPSDVEGGGFLYTNRDSISIGIILNMRSVAEGRIPMYEVLEDYKQHPFIARLIEGSTLLEYSGCFVGEAGFGRVPKVYGPGYLIAGSAAGLFLNTGFTLRGMDFAIESGRLAGEAAVRAVRAHDVSMASLASYHQALAASFAFRELESFKGYPGVFSNPRLYGIYPRMMNEVLHRLYQVDGAGRPHLKKVLTRAYRGKVSALRVLRDLNHAARDL